MRNYVFTRVVIKIKIFHLCRTRVVRVVLVLHSCRSCVALVLQSRLDRCLYSKLT